MRSTRLSHLADGWLMHDRAILVPCDDSVVRVVDGAELPIRRSRGYAPLPVALPVPVPPTLAVGADLKNTMAVAEGRYAWLSQHIGDMDDLATLSAFDSARQHLRALTGVRPEFLSPTRIRGTGPPRGRTATPPAGPVRIGAAPSRSHRRGDGRTRPGRLPAGARLRLRRNRLRPRRRRLGRRGPARRLQGLPAAGPAEVRSAGRRRRQRAAALPDGAGASVGGRDDLGTTIWRRCAPARRTSGAYCATNSRPGWDARRHRAWAGCSTPFPRWPASARWSPTRRRRPSSWRGCPATRIRARPLYRFADRPSRRLACADRSRRPLLQAVVDDVRRGVHAGVIGARFHAALVAG